MHSTLHPFFFIAMFLWPLCASCAISWHIKIKINFLHVLAICTILCSPCLMLFKCYLTLKHHHLVHRHFLLCCVSNVIYLITHVIFKDSFIASVDFYDSKEREKWILKFKLILRILSWARMTQTFIILQ